MDYGQTPQNPSSADNAFFTDAITTGVGAAREDANPDHNESIQSSDDTISWELPLPEGAPTVRGIGAAAIDMDPLVPTQSESSRSIPESSIYSSEPSSPESLESPESPDTSSSKSPSLPSFPELPGASGLSKSSEASLPSSPELPASPTSEHLTSSAQELSHSGHAESLDQTKPESSPSRRLGDIVTLDNDPQPSPSSSTVDFSAFKEGARRGVISKDAIANTDHLVHEFNNGKITPAELFSDVQQATAAYLKQSFGRNIGETT